MKVLVTGGSGFLGSHVSDALTKAGHEVSIFDLRVSPYLTGNQEMILGDITDLDAVTKAAEGCDAIYHLAGLADIDEAIHRPLETVQINMVGTTHALEAANTNKVSRFILASSIYVYSSKGSFYRTSKQTCELLVQDYRERFGLPYTILRYGSLYGPRADGHNAVHRLISQALTERRMAYGGSGNEVREYIHVVDAAEASVEMLAPEFEDEIIHLMGHERIKTREMLDMINEMIGGDVKVETDSGAMVGHYVQTPYNYIPRLGKKYVRTTYIDLGLGLLDCMNSIGQPDAEK
jgi:UDP-glucose 4-epimerase